jgi:magnesium transporter
MVGVVIRADFDEASADQASRTLLRFSGIVLGEEFRTMPLLNRVGGRLAWLATTLLLSFSAASVVGLFQNTLSEFIALAVFLPVISGMSGNAGNQAIAVSMRELSLGLIKPHEIIWVLTKEAAVGAINGLALGIALTLVALLWKGNLYLGLVVGGAQSLSILLAACLGGIVPMFLKRLGFDPAVASAPLLTTITDAAGFFLTLGLASIWLTN